MNINPELRRNIWLELTPLRLAGMPLVLGAIFFLAWLGDEQQFGSSVKGVSLSLYIALTFLWGVRQSSESVFVEIRERTWDWQRMSSINPWTLGWGKLLGSTVYPWYGAGICLFFYLLATDNKPDSIPVSKELLFFVASGLMIQAISMLASLQAIIRYSGFSRSHASVIMLLGFAAIAPTMSLTVSSRSFEWYRITVSQIDFALISALCFLGWSLLGIYNQLRNEFRMRTLPVSWSGFILFLMIYTAGFASNSVESNKLSMYLAIAFTVSVAMTYLMIFLECKDQVAARRMLADFKARNWRRFAEEMPCWLVTIPFVIVSALLLMLLPVNLLPDTGAFESKMLLLTILAFMTRDICMLVFLNMASNPKRADLFAILLLNILYGLLPGIFMTLDAKAATAFFWPIKDLWWFSLPAALAQAALVIWLLARRWKATEVALVTGQRQ